MSASEALMRRLSMSYLTGPMPTPLGSIAVAASAGCEHVGLRLGPVYRGDPPSPLIGDAAMMLACRCLLADHGMSVLEVEGFTITEDIDFAALSPVIETASEFGEATLLAVADLRGRITLDELIERVARLVELARAQGLRVAFEPIAHRAAGSLEDALHVAVHSGAGLALDMLHLHRMQVAPEQLRSIDRRLIHAIHFCDAPPIPPDLQTMIRHSACDRDLPGDGVLPIRAYLDALPQDLPLSVEIPMERLAAMKTPQERAQMCIAAARSYLTNHAGK